MAKIYRIHLIINAVGLKNVVVSERFAVYILLALLSFFLIYLIILATVGSPSPATVYSTSPYGLKTYQNFCKMKEPGVNYFIYAIEAIMIIAAVGINAAINNAPMKIHQSVVELRGTAPFDYFTISSSNQASLNYCSYYWSSSLLCNCRGPRGRTRIRICHSSSCDRLCFPPCTYS